VACSFIPAVNSRAVLHNIKQRWVNVQRRAKLVGRKRPTSLDRKKNLCRIFKLSSSPALDEQLRTTLAYLWLSWVLKLLEVRVAKAYVGTCFGDPLAPLRLNAYLCLHEHANISTGAEC
jgi:hypothetical protein